ncbi:MAG TPA: metallophosphoesterase family protein [Candidatus Limnocylindria bacterium]|nr:metallophosphoesterase family protein [Candidatus Limnocylindria bacterium]
MRIGVVSDTHLPRFGRALPAALVRGVRAERIGLILHCGDLTAPFVVDLLEELAPVEAVAGNNDSPELHARYGTRRILEVEDVRIGITHGHLGRGRSTPARVAAAFAPGEVAVVLYGHSHIPALAYRDGRWLMNPGSPTDRRREPRFSFGVLEVSAGRVVEAGHRFFSRRE